MGSAAAGAAPVPPAAVDPAVAAPSAATEIPAGPGAPPDDERTILIAGRGADATPAWLLILDTGERIGLATESVVLGRKPGAVEYGVPGVAVPDPTKTVSKVHARLDRVGDHWSITDLGSTNGTSLVEPGGRERLLARGGSEVVRGRFLLGEVGLVLVRNPEAAR